MKTTAVTARPMDNMARPATCRHARISTEKSKSGSANPRLASVMLVLMESVEAGSRSEMPKSRPAT